MFFKTLYVFWIEQYPIYEREKGHCFNFWIKKIKKTYAGKRLHKLILSCHAAKRFEVDDSLFQQTAFDKDEFCTLQNTQKQTLRHLMT